MTRDCLLGANAAILVVTLATSLVAPVGARAQKPKATVWDAVYTDAQAARGQKAFLQSCAGCHRADLSGGDDNEPALQGPNFTLKWDDATLAELYDFIATNMPKNKPGSVSLESCVDILSLILKVNKMPAGETELTTDVKQLDQIRFTAKPPAR